MGPLIASVGRTAYLDTNIFIYFLEAHPQYSSALLNLFEAIDEAKLQAFTSELSLAECLVKPFADQDATRQHTYESFLTSRPAFQVVPVSRSVLVSAARLRATNKLRLPDSIHLATALELACDTFVTNDQLVKPTAGITVLQLENLI